MVQAAPGASVAPVHLSELAVKKEPPPSNEMVGLTVVELSLVTVKVLGGELVPRATTP
jgi:hypothetical protein